jgi:polysaccharide export outer membrane protein
MNISATLLGLLALVFSLSAGPARAGAPVDESYTLLPGDVVEISVWGEELLQKQVLVRPDGGISFPFADNVQAKGRTITDVSGELKKKINKFVPDAVVTVSLVQNAGNRIYVLGRVNKPGEFLVPRPVDVMQALAMAGGLTPFADRDTIRVLRRDGAAPQVTVFNYEQVERGEALEQNILLRAGDVIMVP